MIQINYDKTLCFLKSSHPYVASQLTSANQHSTGLLKFTQEFQAEQDAINCGS
jgi:hypothetical protein